MSDTPSSFAKSNTFAFFPTYVWAHDVAPEDRDAIEASVGARLKELLPADGQLAVGRSYQTRTDMQTDAAFARLLALAEEAARAALAFLDYAPLPLRVTGCWANVSPPGVHHPEHLHPNNVLSGVYYLRAPPGANTINFHDPRPQAHIIAPPVTKESPKHASTLHLGAAPGRMFLFPAWVRHSVNTNESREVRVSVAFNFVLENFIDAASKPRFDGNLET